MTRDACHLPVLLPFWLVVKPPPVVLLLVTALHWEVEWGHRTYAVLRLQPAQLVVKLPVLATVAQRRPLLGGLWLRLVLAALRLHFRPSVNEEWKRNE